MEIEVNGQKLWMDYESWWKQSEWLDWKKNMFPYVPTREQEEQFHKDLQIKWNKTITQKTT